jgi:hypothetical protein
MGVLGAMVGAAVTRAVKTVLRIWGFDCSSNLCLCLVSDLSNHCVLVVFSACVLSVSRWMVVPAVNIIY